MKKYTNFDTLRKEVLLDGEPLGSALRSWKSLSDFTAEISTALNQGKPQKIGIWATLPSSIGSKIVENYVNMTAEFQNKVNKAATEGRAGAAMLLFLSKIGVYRFVLVTTDDMNQVMNPTGGYQVIVWEFRTQSAQFRRDFVSALPGL
jgi:hypothetical protein